MCRDSTAIACSVVIRDFPNVVGHYVSAYGLSIVFQPLLVTPLPYLLCVSYLAHSVRMEQ